MGVTGQATEIWFNNRNVDVEGRGHELCRGRQTEFGGLQYGCARNSTKSTRRSRSKSRRVPKGADLADPDLLVK